MVHPDNGVLCSMNVSDSPSHDTTWKPRQCMSLSEQGSLEGLSTIDSDPVASWKTQLWGGGGPTGVIARGGQGRGQRTEDF